MTKKLKNSKLNDLEEKTFLFANGVRYLLNITKNNLKVDDG